MASTDVVGISVEAFRADWAYTDVVGASLEACRAHGASTDVAGASALGIFPRTLWLQYNGQL